MMASSYYQNLIKRVLEASTTDNWEIAVREWDIVAVSYTHLDVYKRQIVYSIVLIIILKASCVTSANKILVLKIIWCFLLGFSFACFYRVISFVMFVLFAEDNDSRSNDIPENKLIDDERKRELQEKYKK